MAQKFRKALELVSKDHGLTEADHAHLARWSAGGYPEDPLWEKLSTDARARGMLPPNSIYPEIIREALVMRRHAESVRSGTDFELRERQQRRDHLLDLAKKANDLAEYYKWAAEYPGMESYFMRFLKPVSDLQELHQKEAELLRQRAGHQRQQTIARLGRLVDLSLCGFSSTGFMWTLGGVQAARACSARARPISPPSPVTAALFDMFCGLNGRTAKLR